VSPTTVDDGQVLTFTVTMTANQNTTNNNIGFAVTTPAPSYTTVAGTFFVSGVSFTAGVPVTTSTTWSVPAGTSGGSYLAFAGIWNSSWSYLTGTTTPFTIFGVGSVNGTCGSANGVAVSTAPSTNLCSAGTASGVTGSGPWDWTCAGSEGGSTASCSAPPTFTNGQCGSMNGAVTNVTPTSGLCNAGTASAVSGNDVWDWICTGSSGGSTASCEAYTPTTPDKPGPSIRLFNSPYYTCVNNYYVSTTGSDSNNGTSPSTPWLTLQNANNSLPTGGAAAGSCINVAPGTYDGVTITNGGNYASSTGYVVYRCTTLDGCTIDGDAGLNGSSAFFFATAQPMPAYVMVDGFNMVGLPSNQYYAVGFNLWAGNNNFNPSTHHVWVMNSTVSGFGQSGISMSQGEYLYAIHNTVDGNSNVQCDAQGSGIAMNWPIALSGYTPTADDLNNLIVGDIGSSFHNAIKWNVLYNNGTTQCGSNATFTGSVSGTTLTIQSGSVTGTILTGMTLYGTGITSQTPPPSITGGSGLTWTLSAPLTIASEPLVAANTYDTDGNNIILDTWSWSFLSSPVPYTGGGLVAFNVTYNSGGGGVHIFYSEDVTAANNTCYNNYLDVNDANSARGCIDTYDSYGDTVVNNIAVAIPSTPPLTPCYADYIFPFTMWNKAITGGPPAATGYPANTYSHNITDITGSNCGGETDVWNGDTYSASANMESTNPLWVNVGTTSVGTETTQPVGSNFALQSDSPAIGYGLTAAFLPASSIDAGACSSAFTTCP
jgi:hypothetical protein